MKANVVPETYPMQFRDKIDEYLWKEHHILGGCCSSIEEMKYSVAREVAEKLTDAFIEKACEWIKTNMDDYIHVEYDTVTGMPTNEAHIANKIVIEDFKNYIKGE
jgi:hypothetical protein